MFFAGCLVFVHDLCKVDCAATSDGLVACPGTQALHFGKAVAGWSYSDSICLCCWPKNIPASCRFARTNRQQMHMGTSRHDFVAVVLLALELARE